MEAAMLRFNTTVRLWMPNYNSTAHVYGSGANFEKLYVERTMQDFAATFVSDDVQLLKATAPVLYTFADTHQNHYFVDLLLGSEYVADFNNHNYTNVKSLFLAITSSFENFVASASFSTKLVEYSKTSKKMRSSLEAATVSFPPTYISPTGDLANDFTEYMRYQTPNPNPYAEFCRLGCTYFFSMGDQEIQATKGNDALEANVYLSDCTNKCDDFYAYNITVGYSDLAETARLECRDGCQIALKRCRPGYKCTQVVESFEGSGIFSDGSMEYCPTGTYRDVAYDTVEECVDCPQGKYREAKKGRYMESCSKCPVGTYVNETGSSSILDCQRCPAGTFGSEPGLALCLCITKSSCLGGTYRSVDGVQTFESFIDPADAEKRATFPFIGRW